MRDPDLIIMTLGSFFIALLASYLFALIFKKFRFPWAISLILGGIILGPYGLGVFEVNKITTFLSEVGLIFLMFLAGMEIKLSSIKNVWKESISVALVTGLVPALFGFGVGMYFGYDISVSIVLGIILINSSFAVVIPALEERGVLHTRFGKIIVSSTMLQDISSLILFVIALQFLIPGEFMSPYVLILFIFFALIVGTMVKISFPKLRSYFSEKKKFQHRHPSIYENRLKLILVVIIGTALLFEIFKFETIIGAFFVGLVMSEMIKSKVLKLKLHAISYGVFIPIFFVVVGAWIDLSLFKEISVIGPILLVIVFGSMASKFISGWLSTMMIGMSSYRGAVLGMTCVPQLITTIALAMISERLGLLPPEIVTSIIFLATVSVIISPMITNKLLDQRFKKR